MNKPLPVTNTDAFQALRYAEFRFYFFVSFLTTMAQMIQEVIIGYELYRLTHDPMAIGFLGLAEAAPFILLSLFGGHFADKFSKKKLIIWSLALIMAASFALYALSFHILSSENAQDLKYVIWGNVFFIGVCRAFYSPSITSLRAFLIPREAYANASTWSSASWQSGVIVGPAVSGFLYNMFGFSNTLLFVIGLIGLSIVFAALIKDRVVEQGKEVSVIQRIKEGFSYVYKTKVILYSISLDMFSVMFGGVTAIMPIFAQDILHVGPEELGILRAAPSVGAVLVLLILSKKSPMEHAWRNLMLAVTGFGAATLVFAVSQNFILSVAAIFLTGALDSISVVIRSTVLQLLTPDNMRGRVNAINGIFLSTSNEVGAFESGLAAKILGTVPSVIFGGAMTLLVTGYIFLRSKTLLKMKITG